jgi:type IV pilus assembly protein PilW
MAISRYAQRGVTLIELMVAMTISLFLLIAIGLVYQSSKSGFTYANNTVRLGEDASFAIDALSRDIRMASYGGCSGSSWSAGPDKVFDKTEDVTANDDIRFPKITNVNANTFTLTGTAAPNPFSKSIFNAQEAIVGYVDKTAATTAATSAGVTTPSFLGTSTSYTVKDTSPILFVAGGSQKAVQVSAAIAKNQKLANLGNDVNKWSNSGSGILMLLSDCKNSEVFRTFTLQSSGAITAESNFLADYGADATITPLVTSTYFLATRTGALTPSLYRRYFNGKVASVPEELVSNVEAITYQYGLNTSFLKDAAGVATTNPSYIADEYVKDSDAKFATMDWSRVVSVRIGLIIVTEDAGQTNTTTASIPWIGGAYTPANTTDRRMRRAYSTTVSIRNRVAL